MTPPEGHLFDSGFLLFDSGHLLFDSPRSSARWAQAAAAPFASREAIRAVPGVGPKTFANVAGFLRVPNDAEPLDGTRVHPEAYGDARRLLRRAGVSDADLSSLTARGGGLSPEHAAALRGVDVDVESTDHDLVTLLTDPCLAGDPRLQLSPPPVLKTNAPLTLADCAPGMRQGHKRVLQCHFNSSL